MPTKVCPVPLEEVGRCHAGCVAFFAQSRGLEFATDTCKAVLRLMLVGQLSRKELAVARALIWLETRVLRPTGRANEARTEAGRRVLLSKKRDAWLLVEAERVTSEHEAMLMRLSDIRFRIHRKSRQIHSQVLSLEADVAEYQRLSKLEAELNDRTMRRVRVECAQAGARAEPGDAAGDELYAVLSDDSEAQLLAGAPSAAAMVGFASTFVRGCMDVRDPRMHYELGLLDLLEPVTVDEWRAAREFLEREFASAGFDTGEVALLLPEGDKEGRRRRATMRRKRGGQRQRPAVDFTSSLPAMFGVGGDPA